jgi:hypothetical protein
MMCLKCESRMGCNQTKNYIDPDKGFVYVERRRVCTKCGLKIFTIEVPVDEFGITKASQSNGEHSE